MREGGDFDFLGTAKADAAAGYFFSAPLKSNDAEFMQ